MVEKSFLLLVPVVPSSSLPLFPGKSSGLKPLLIVKHQATKEAPVGFD
jgi:hypothetical protein